MTKRLLTALAVFVMVVACLFAVSSCKRNHEHNYTAKDVAATCTEAGYKLFECSCGESYREPTDAALGHALTNHVGKAATCSKDGYGAYVACTRCDYSSKVVVPALGHCYSIGEISYPTSTEAGSKQLVCEMCGDTKVENISAASFAFPAASDILASLIGEAEIAVNASPDTVFIISEELDNYATDTGVKAFYALKLAEASLANVEGIPQGYVKLEIGMAKFELDGTVDPDSLVPSSFDSLLVTNLYLNGEVLSFENDVNGEKTETEHNLSELFYTVIGQNFGVTYEDVLMASYTVSEFVDLVPTVQGLIEAMTNVKLPEVSEAYRESMTKLLQSVLENISVVSTDENGNTVATTDLKALGALIDNINGKTVSQYIDEAYGAGSADNLKKNIIGLPDMMLKEIADSAITFANNYGVNVDDIYSFVDLFVYVASNGEAQVSIKYEIEKNYHLTLAELMTSGAEGSDKEEAIANFKEGLAETVNMLADCTFNQLFNGFVYGNPDYIPEGETETFQFLDELKAILGELNDVVYLTTVTDAEGIFVSMKFAAGNFDAMLERVIETDDAHIVINTVYQGVDLSVDVTLGNKGVSFAFNKGAEELASGYFKNDVVSEIEIDENGFAMEKIISREVTAAVFANGKQYLDFICYSEYDALKLIRLDVNYDATIINTYPDPENQEYVSETVTEFTDLIFVEVVAGDLNDTIYVEIGEFVADVQYVYGADGDVLTFDIGEANGTVYYTEKIDGEDTISTIEGIIYYYDFTFADFKVEKVNGVLRNAVAVVNMIETRDIYEESADGSVVIVRTERYISDTLDISYVADDEGFTIVIADRVDTDAEIIVAFNNTDGFVVAVNTYDEGDKENLILLSLKGEGEDLHISIDTAKLNNYSNLGEEYTRNHYVEFHGDFTITVVLPEVQY